MYNGGPRAPALPPLDTGMKSSFTLVGSAPQLPSTTPSLNVYLADLNLTYAEDIFSTSLPFQMYIS